MIVKGGFQDITPENTPYEPIMTSGTWGTAESQEKNDSVTGEQKLKNEFPDLAEGMLGHCFQTTTPDEDGSDLPMLVMPVGWVVEWMKILRKKASQEGAAERQKEIVFKLRDWASQHLTTNTYIEKFIVEIEHTHPQALTPSQKGKDAK